MFRIKENLNIENQRKFAEEVGIAKETLSRILTKSQNCSKVIAYSITKHYDLSKEIEDFFERVG